MAEAFISTEVTSTPNPMVAIAKATLGATIFAMVAFSSAKVQACEKHVNGHQNGSDTHQEVQSGGEQR